MIGFTKRGGKGSFGGRDKNSVGELFVVFRLL